MALPQVADEGYDLKVWRVAGTTLNKELSRAVNAWSPKLEFGPRAYNSPEGNSIQRNVKLRLGNGRTISLERPKQTKSFMRFGT
jgi:hypothetical protein